MLLKVVRAVYFGFSTIRLLPHFMVFILSKNIETIKYDILRYLQILNNPINKYFGLFFLLSTKKEFRNIFYFRIGRISYFLNFLCPKLDSLYLPTKYIGKGCYFEHGFSTIVAAESIGDNVWINQQVTIGYKDRINGPTIMNNVTIGAGAIVIGKIIIGNNSIIGAGAVVTKSVPPDCTVVGNPARVIRREGEKVDIKL